MTAGGWTLHATCGGCGRVTSWAAPVPSLIADQVERSGWLVDVGPQARPAVETRDALCPPCTTEEN